MKTFLFAATALALAAAPGAALAQSGTVSGAAGGAVTGAIVGGPVGAAVGGIAGAALGTILAPPSNDVQKVVVAQPGQSVAIDGTVAAGEPLPDVVMIQPVPGYDTYSYAVVNQHHVIVDPKTRTVIQVLD